MNVFISPRYDGLADRVNSASSDSLSYTQCQMSTYTTVDDRAHCRSLNISLFFNTRVYGENA